MDFTAEITTLKQQLSALQDAHGALRDHHARLLNYTRSIAERFNDHTEAIINLRRDNAAFREYIALASHHLNQAVSLSQSVSTLAEPSPEQPHSAPDQNEQPSNESHKENKETPKLKRQRSSPSPRQKASPVRKKLSSPPEPLDASIDVSPASLVSSPQIALHPAQRARIGAGGSVFAAAAAAAAPTDPLPDYKLSKRQRSILDALEPPMPLLATIGSLEASQRDALLKYIELSIEQQHAQALTVNAQLPEPAFSTMVNITRWTKPYIKGSRPLSAQDKTRLRSEIALMKELGQTNYARKKILSFLPLWFDNVGVHSWTVQNFLRIYCTLFSRTRAFTFPVDPDEVEDFSVWTIPHHALEAISKLDFPLPLDTIMGSLSEPQVKDILSRLKTIIYYAVKIISSKSPPVVPEPANSAIAVIKRRLVPNPTTPGLPRRLLTPEEIQMQRDEAKEIIMMGFNGYSVQRVEEHLESWPQHPNFDSWSLLQLIYIYCIVRERVYKFTQNCKVRDPKLFEGFEDHAADRASAAAAASAVAAAIIAKPPPAPPSDAHPRSSEEAAAALATIGLNAPSNYNNSMHHITNYHNSSMSSEDSNASEPMLSSSTVHTYSASSSLPGIPLMQSPHPQTSDLNTLGDVAIEHAVSSSSSQSNANTVAVSGHSHSYMMASSDVKPDIDSMCTVAPITASAAVSSSSMPTPMIKTEPMSLTSETMRVNGLVTSSSEESSPVTGNAARGPDMFDDLDDDTDLDDEDMVDNHDTGYNNITTPANGGMAGNGGGMVSATSTTSASTNPSTASVVSGVVSVAMLSTLQDDDPQHHTAITEDDAVHQLVAVSADLDRADTFDDDDDDMDNDDDLIDMDDDVMRGHRDTVVMGIESVKQRGMQRMRSSA